MPEEPELSSGKILIACFSHSGNTRVIAEQIRETTGGVLLEIQPVEDYPSEYQAVTAQAKREIGANYKPRLKPPVVAVESYAIAFIGSPNWWNTIAPPVAAFLADYRFGGQTIIPFVTHEGGGMGRAVSDIRKLCPDALVADGRPFRGSGVHQARGDVNEWLQKINFWRNEHV